MTSSPTNIFKNQLFRKSIYVLFVISGLTIALGQKLGITWWSFFQNYWNDLIIIPLILKVVLWILRKIRGNNFSLHPFYILFGCLYFSILFEYILPKFHARYTADFLDVFMYFLGGFIFYILENDTYKMSEMWRIQHR